MRASTPTLGDDARAFVWSRVGQKLGVGLQPALELPPPPVAEGTLALDNCQDVIADTILRLKGTLKHREAISGELLTSTQNLLAWNETCSTPGVEVRQYVGGALDLRIETEEGRQSMLDTNFWFAGLTSQEFLDSFSLDYEQLVNRIAVARKSRLPPAAAPTYVFAPQAAGVALHEAVGHGLEWSILEKAELNINDCPFGTKQLNASDSPDIQGLFGTRRIDDTGRPVSARALIVDGEIVGRFELEIHRVDDSGNRWRSTYQAPALERVSNLLVKPTSTTLENLLASNCGIYVVQAGEGVVNENDLTLSLNIKEAYVNERGKLSAPLLPFVLSVPLRAFWSGIVEVADRTADFGMYCEKRQTVVPVAQRTPAILVVSNDVFKHTLHEPLRHISNVVG
jgi:predicted Zn-dependent protease